MTKWIAPRRGGYQPSGEEPAKVVAPKGGGGVGRLPRRDGMTDEEYREWVAWRLDLAAGAP